MPADTREEHTGGTADGSERSSLSVDGDEGAEDSPRPPRDPDAAAAEVEGPELTEWLCAGHKADLCLKRRDYSGLAAAAEGLCALQPQRRRGWMLQWLSLVEQEASLDQLQELFQRAQAACDDEVLRCELERALAAAGSSSSSSIPGEIAVRHTPSGEPVDGVQTFVGEWDAEGVFVYQAFRDEIADYALLHQRFGGPCFKTTRMTWIKPSFGWVLYRSGYGHKPGQHRVLKIKLPHGRLASILAQCRFVDTNKATKGEAEGAHGGSNGRVQWDPERDMMSADGREPREMLRKRAIQIGLRGRLSDFYTSSTISIQDVTELAHRVCEAHRAKPAKMRDTKMAQLVPELPDEQPYLPACPEQVLAHLGMRPGANAAVLACLGRGKAKHAKASR